MRWLATQAMLTRAWRRPVDEARRTPAADERDLLELKLQAHGEDGADVVAARQQRAAAIVQQRHAAIEARVRRAQRQVRGQERARAAPAPLEEPFDAQVHA